MCIKLNLTIRVNLRIKLFRYGESTAEVDTACLSLPRYVPQCIALVEYFKRHSLETRFRKLNNNTTAMVTPTAKGQIKGFGGFYANRVRRVLYFTLPFDMISDGLSVELGSSGTRYTLSSSTGRFLLSRRFVYGPPYGVPAAGCIPRPFNARRRSNKAHTIESKAITPSGTPTPAPITVS